MLGNPLQILETLYTIANVLLLVVVGGGVKQYDGALVFVSSYCIDKKQICRLTGLQLLFVPCCWCCCSAFATVCISSLLLLLLLLQLLQLLVLLVLLVQVLVLRLPVAAVVVVVAVQVSIMADAVVFAVVGHPHPQQQQQFHCRHRCCRHKVFLKIPCLSCSPHIIRHDGLHDG